METDDPIDLADLLARCMDDRVFVREILGVFHDQARAHLAQLQACVKVGDRKGTRSYAHAMKGSAANLSAGRLSRACQELEIATDRTSADGMASTLAAVERELDRCVAFFPEIHARLDREAPSP